MSGAYDLEELEDYLQNPNKTATSAAMQYVAALKKVLEEGGQQRARIHKPPRILQDTSMCSPTSKYGSPTLTRAPVYANARASHRTSSRDSCVGVGGQRRMDIGGAV